MTLLLKKKKKKNDLLLNGISSTDFYLFYLFSTFCKTFQATLQVTDPYKSPSEHTKDDCGTKKRKEKETTYQT